MAGKIEPCARFVTSSACLPYGAYQPYQPYLTYLTYRGA
jgi:hypothetical protein